VQLSFQQVNPHAGNESLLLRYRRDGSATEICLLIDAGHGVDLNGQLTEDDELAAICLTHAHADHYQSVADCLRDETTLYASPQTVSVLDTVLELAGRQDDVSQLDLPDERFVGIDSWTEVVPGVSIHPIPAGHAPGAVGYLIRFTDGTDTRHVLATGDFTVRRAAGYPGFDDGIADIDVLLLTVASEDRFREKLSEGLGTALQRATAGSQTLLATTGLLGVHVTYLLSELAIALERSVTIRPVGQVATLYEAMDYDCRHVDPVPVFERTDECLSAGTIAIAGPESPTDGSSGRLFEAICEDPNACLVQLYNDHASPVSDGQCTTESYRVINHPAFDTIDDVHDALDPVHTVIVHQHGGGADEFNYLDSYVWSPTDTADYVLYDDGWQKPPWFDGGSVSQTTAGETSLGTRVKTDIVDAFSLPSLERHDSVALEAEGVDVDRVREIVSQGAAAEKVRPTANPTSKYSTTGGQARTTTVDGETTDGDAATETGTRPAEETETVSTDATSERATHVGAATVTASDGSTVDQTDRGETGSTDTGGPSDGALTDTVGSEINDVDPRMQRALDAGEVTLEDLRVMKALSEHEPDTEDDEDETESSTETESESLSGEATETPSEADIDNAESPGDTDDETSTGADTSAEVETSESIDSQTKACTDTTVGTNQSTQETNDLARWTSQAHAGAEETVMTVTLSPLTVALAEHVVETTDAESIAAAVTRATREYLEALLAGEVDPPATAPIDISFDGSPYLDMALERVVDHADSESGIAGFVAASVGRSLNGETESVSVAVPRWSIDAVLENSATVVDTRAAVVTTAVQYRLATDDLGN